jgi:hypothetical protein
MNITIRSYQKKFIIENGRMIYIKQVEKELDSFLGWLKYCTVLRTESNGTMPKRIFPFKKEIENRIDRITNP